MSEKKHPGGDAGTRWLGQLKEGDIVRNASGRSYVVVSVSYPNGPPPKRPHVVAVRSITITNPSEWELIA